MMLIAQLSPTALERSALQLCSLSELTTDLKQARQGAHAPQRVKVLGA
eukprot:CAMPEP_0180797008 /NCGR_PEP_ID=MMETSP1038_2-20121128/57125_1 /TAXON_ID=632150 /ORGANISM="Azadinium spinosum, Strain 3D9" /LENGTH=47 /DNA_ID= /DNA_START= /DNA_END= /DNA_ORIENTATION=